MIRVVVLAGISLCGLVVQAAYGATNLPPELSLAIRTAVVHHPEVAMAESEVLAAKAMVAAGGYRWYPKVEVSSHAGSSQTGGAGNRSLNLGLKQPLWDAGRVDADFDSAKASEFASLSAEGVMQEGVGTRASNAYFGVLRAREQKQVAKHSVEDHSALYSSVVRRKDGGLGALSDVTLASSRLQQARAAEVQWQGEIDRADAAYLSVVNEQPPVTMSELDVWEVDGGLQGAVAVAKGRSPVLEKLRNELLVAEANVKSKKAQQFPTLYARVDHTSYLGGSTNSFYQDDTRFTVNFEWQNDVALTQRYQVEAAEQKVVAARRAIEAAERQLVETLTGYWQDFTTSRQRREELKKFENSAAETVGMFRRQFTIGRRSWPEVVNSLQDLYSAQNQQVEAKYQTMTARMKLAFLTGEMEEYIHIADGGASDNRSESIGRDATQHATALESVIAPTKIQENTKPDLAAKSLEKDSQLNAVIVAHVIQAVPPATTSSVLEVASSKSIKQSDPKQDVKEVINKWVNAWSSRNVDDYLACYAPDISILHGKSRSDWEKERRHKLVEKALIQVELKHLKVSVNGDSAKASFRQIYSTDGKIIRTNKTMMLRKYGNDWLIIQEKIVS